MERHSCVCTPDLSGKENWGRRSYWTRRRGEAAPPVVGSPTTPALILVNRCVCVRERENKIS